MQKNLEYPVRVMKVNELIATIAGCGRKFWQHNGNLARMELDDRGRVWFVDPYRGKRIYTHTKRTWRGFTSGGTLRALVEHLRDFIKTGRQIVEGKYVLGPWPDWYCKGDLWGYGESMATVQAKALELGIVRPSALSAAE